MRRSHRRRGKPSHGHATRSQLARSRPPPDGAGSPDRAAGRRDAASYAAVVPANVSLLFDRLLSFSLALPGAWEDHPWDDLVVKVGKKIFVFIGSEQHPTVSVKLPDSKEQALLLGCARPTGYGLGKAGWVTVSADGPECPPVDVLEDWIEESYRTIAPKKLIAELDAGSR